MSRSLAGLSLFIVTLCLCLAPVTQASATLQVWNSDASPATLEWYQSLLVPQFEKAHPGFTVQVTKTPWGTNYNNKIVTSYAAGVGPDIIYGGAEYVDGFVENGFVIPLDGRVSAWPAWKDMIPPTLGAVTYKNRIYGVPVFMDFRMTAINRDLFLKAGYNPEKPPATWDEFISTAKRLTRRSGEEFEVRGMFVGGGYQEFNQIVWQNGGTMLNETKTEAAFNSSAGIEALTYWVNAIQEVSDGKQLGGIDNLLRGRVAMLYQVVPHNFVRTAKSNGLSAEEIAGNLVPPLGRVVAQGGIFTNWMGIGSQSEYPDLAWEFLQMHLDLENYAAYSEVNAGVPTRLSMLRTEYVRSNPWLEKALRLASVYGRPTWTAVEFSRLRDALGPELGKAFRAEIPPREAIENAAKLWKGILSEQR